MGRLAQNSELYRRYVKTLDQQETELEQVRKEIEALTRAERQQKRELNEYLLGLDIGSFSSVSAVVCLNRAGGGRRSPRCARVSTTSKLYVRI
jgi:hypothetical protein